MQNFTGRLKVQYNCGNKEKSLLQNALCIKPESYSYKVMIWNKESVAKKKKKGGDKFLCNLFQFLVYLGMVYQNGSFPVVLSYAPSSISLEQPASKVNLLNSCIFSLKRNANVLSTRGERTYSLDIFEQILIYLQKWNNPCCNLQRSGGLTSGIFL